MWFIEMHGMHFYTILIFATMSRWTVWTWRVTSNKQAALHAPSFLLFEWLQEQLLDFHPFLIVWCTNTISTPVDAVGDARHIHTGVCERKRESAVTERILVDHFPSLYGQISHGLASVMLRGSVLWHVNGYRRWRISSLQLFLHLHAGNKSQQGLVWI